jgi:osmotically-inducible protein OsmY
LALTAPNWSTHDEFWIADGDMAIDSGRKGLTRMTSSQLQTDVQEELEWDPKVDARHIVITAHDGAVTLSGFVPTYFDRLRAVAAAEHVHGVKAIADELEVHVHQTNAKQDSDIADSVVHVLEWTSALADQDIRATVSNGRVTLIGEVDWNYQREVAERAVNHLVGVTSVINRITVKLRVAAKEVERQITNALARHAALDSRYIHVTTSGTNAILSGHVHSFEEARIAKNAAWSAPGISAVDDDLLVIQP